MENELSTRYTSEELASGITDEHGGVYSQDGKRLLRYNGTNAEYTVKDGVEVICNKAFSAYGRDLSSDEPWPVKKVVLPDSLRAIGLGAFDGCELLESIVIPSSVATIEDETFSGCRGLKSVVLPNGVKSIGKSAFYECEQLERIDIPETVVEIGKYAFERCESLKEIKLPDGVTEIPRGLFTCCFALERCELGNQVTKIGDRAFREAKALTSIILPETVRELGYAAFSNCESLKEVSLPEGLEKLDFSCFGNCKQLTSITLPASLQEMGVNPFAGCSCNIVSHNPQYKFENDILTSADGTALIAYLGDDDTYTVSQDVKTIKAGAFYYKDSLKEITIPATVEKVEGECIYQCIYDCPALEKVTIENPELECEKNGLIGYNPNFKALVIPPKTKGRFAKLLPDHKEFMLCAKAEAKAGSKKSKVAPAVADDGKYSKDGKTLKKYEGTGTTYTVASGCQTIGSKAFFNNKLLETVVIADTVTEIEHEAFAGCTSLKEITFPSKLTSICTSAFSGCSALGKIVFNDSLKSIGGEAFKECKALKEVALPKELVKIEQTAFENCEALGQIHFPDYLEVVNGFSLCTSLEKVVLPKKCKKIGAKAFSHCWKLTDVTIPEGVESIGFQAFYKCPLKPVTLPQSLQEMSNPFNPPIEVEILSPNFKIEGNAIYSADGTTLVAIIEDEVSFVVPEAVKTIATGALYNAYSLETVYLPAGLENVKYWNEFSNVETICIPPKTKDKFIPLVDITSLTNNKKKLKVVK